MGVSAKYGFEALTDYTVTGWNGILSTNIQRIDSFLKTYIPVVLAETIAKYKAVALDRSGEGIKAQANGVKQPSLGLTIEAGDASDTVLIRRCGLVTNVSWSWTKIGKPIYLSTTVAGDLTQTVPLVDQQILGTVVAADTIFLDVFYDMGKSTQATATTTTSTTTTSSSTTTTTP